MQRKYEQEMLNGNNMKIKPPTKTLMKIKMLILMQKTTEKKIIKKCRFFLTRLHYATSVFVFLIFFPMFLYGQSIPIIIGEAQVDTSDIPPNVKKIAKKISSADVKTKTTARPKKQVAAKNKTVLPQKTSSSKIPQQEKIAENKNDTQNSNAANTANNATNNAMEQSNENEIAGLEKNQNQEVKQEQNFSTSESVPFDLTGENQTDETNSQESDENELASEELNEEQKPATSETLFQIARVKEASGLFNEAMEFYKKVAEMQDKYYLPALYRLAYLSGRNGEEKPTSEADFLNDEEKSALYYHLAGGLETAFLQNPKEKSYIDKAFTAYEQSVRLAPQSKWAAWAKLRMARLYFNRKEYDNSLTTLLSFMNMQKMKNAKQEDLAWFLLGRIMQVSEKHYDPIRAMQAYRKTIAFDNSIYQEPAAMYLQDLEKKYFIGN